MSATNTARAIILIILAVVIFALGAGAGVFYQMFKDAPKLDAADKMAGIVKGFSSKMASSIVMYGTVSEVSGRNVTLAYAGDSITVAIPDSAKIYTFASASADSKITSTQLPAQFKDIKKGSNLNVNLKVFNDGKMEGQTVFIMPTFAANTQQ